MKLILYIIQIKKMPCLMDCLSYILVISQKHTRNMHMYISNHLQFPNIRMLFEKVLKWSPICLPVLQGAMTVFIQRFPRLCLHHVTLTDEVMFFFKTKSRLTQYLLWERWVSQTHSSLTVIQSHCMRSIHQSPYCVVSYATCSA